MKRSTKRDAYPTDIRTLPVWRHNERHYQITLSRDHSADGWLEFDTAAGDKRQRYIFNVSWRGNVPNVAISLGKPELGTSMRTRGQAKNDYVLLGLPKKWRKDVHERAVVIARYYREYIIADLDFLYKRVNEYAELFHTVEYSSTRLYMDGEWLISVTENPSGDRYEAKHIGSDKSAFENAKIEWEKAAEDRRKFDESF